MRQPPDREERRPGKGGAHDGGHDVSIRITGELAAWHAAAMLRRRRAGVLCLTPFGDGPADPLDDLAQLAIQPPQGCHGAQFTARGWTACCRGGAA